MATALFALDYDTQFQIGSDPFVMHSPSPLSRSPSTDPVLGSEVGPDYQFFFDDMVIERVPTVQPLSPGNCQSSEISYCSSGYGSSSDVPSTPPADEMKLDDVPDTESGQLLFQGLSESDIKGRNGAGPASKGAELLVPDLEDTCADPISLLAYVDSSQLCVKGRKRPLAVDLNALNMTIVDSKSAALSRPTVAIVPPQHTSGGDSPPVVPTAPAKPTKRKTKQERRSNCQSSSVPRVPSIGASNVTKSSIAKSRVGKPHSKTKAKPSVTTATSASKRDSTSTEQLSPQAEKRRKMEGNRKAAKKFRIKQKMREASMTQTVERLEKANAQMKLELALIKQIKEGSK